MLTQLRNAGVTLSLKKCIFSTETTDYSVHVIRPSRFEIASHATDAIKKLKATRDVTKLRFLHGFFNVFRQLVQNFAGIDLSLNNVSQRDEPFKFWLNKKVLKKMTSSQQILISLAVLALLYAEARFTLYTDACKVQVGCQLLHEQPARTEKPIGYLSGWLTRAQHVYDKTQLERLAIFCAMLLLRP